MVNQLKVHWKAMLANAGMRTQAFMVEGIYQAEVLVFFIKGYCSKLVLSQITSSNSRDTKTFLVNRIFFSNHFTTCSYLVNIILHPNIMSAHHMQLQQLQLLWASSFQCRTDEGPRTSKTSSNIWYFFKWQHESKRYKKKRNERNECFWWEYESKGVTVNIWK